MYEIELKAHVKNPDEVKKILDCVAEYKGHTEKKDFYYHIPKNDGHISVRIRKEKLEFNDTISSTNYFTYKRKELLQGESGKKIEVNNEQEFTLEDITPMEILIQDLGGTVNIKKEKSVDQWILQKEEYPIHIELCNVSKLGYFLEIEVLAENNDEKTVTRIRKMEENIFTECNIPLSEIEDRYYSDMLREIEQLNNN